MANPTPSDEDLALGELLDKEEEQPQAPAPAPEEEEVETPDENQEEENPEDPEAEEPKEEPGEEEEPAEEEEKPVSRRESKRIKQLLEKFATPQQQPQPQVEQRIEAAKKKLIEEGEYSLDQINQMAEDYRQEAYKEGVQAGQNASQNATLFLTRLEIDAPKVAAKHDFLDQNSDNFDPGQASFINELYLKTVGYDPRTGVAANPNIRYDEFVDGVMDLVDLQASAKVVDTKKNITKQAAKTGPRPGGTVKKAYQGDDPTQMSDEQLDAAIAASLGSTRRR
jgi:hypothetical protein